MSHWELKDHTVLPENQPWSRYGVHVFGTNTQEGASRWAKRQMKSVRDFKKLLKARWEPYQLDKEESYLVYRLKRLVED